MNGGEMGETATAQVLTQFSLCINDLICRRHNNVRVDPMLRFKIPDGRGDLLKIAQTLTPSIRINAAAKRGKFFDFVCIAALIVAKRVFVEHGSETAVQVVLLYLSDFNVEHPSNDPDFMKTILGYIEMFVQAGSPADRQTAFREFVEYLCKRCSFR